METTWTSPAHMLHLFTGDVQIFSPSPPPAHRSKPPPEPALSPAAPAGGVLPCAGVAELPRRRSSSPPVDGATPGRRASLPSPAASPCRGEPCFVLPLSSPQAASLQFWQQAYTREELKSCGKHSNPMQRSSIEANTQLIQDGMTSILIDPTSRRLPLLPRRSSRQRPPGRSSSSPSSGAALPPSPPAVRGPGPGGGATDGCAVAGNLPRGIRRGVASRRRGRTTRAASSPPPRATARSASPRQRTGRPSLSVAGG